MTTVSEKTVRAIERAARERASGKPYQGGRADDKLDPAPGWVAFGRWDKDQPAFKPLYLRTSEEPTIPEADTGWDVVERPSRVDLTVWRSARPLRQDIPVVLNADRGDVETEWGELQTLWRPRGGVRPPALRIAGPVSRTGVPWVIENIATDQDSVRRDGRRLVHVQATISLLQFVNPRVPDVKAPRDTDLATEDRPNFTLSKPGDTLRKIAKRDPPDGLGDGRKWVELRKLNPAYKTANAHIPTGTRVRLPNG